MFLITLAKKKGSPDENLVQHNLQECDQLELQPSLGDVTHTEITKEKETSKRNDEKAEAPFPPLNSESSNCSILYKFFEHNDHHKNEQHADLVSDFSLPSDSKISAGSIMGESFEIDDVVEEEDSLIEIKLPSSHLNGLIEDAGPQRKMESNLTVFLPESIFKQQGLLELLAEINEMNEDDSLIEIDISMGSSKC
ncbi:hypothetical protein RIF29_18112 [Crotalaria pallida]|uniref:Uncharacterized protein n=1 Tax=Crotalaria pallida TaxID=3830 RepID=A0AAN9FS49_CROPI